MAQLLAPLKGIPSLTFREAALTPRLGKLGAKVQVGLVLGMVLGEMEGSAMPGLITMEVPQDEVLMMLKRVLPKLLAGIQKLEPTESPSMTDPLGGTALMLGIAKEMMIGTQ